MRRYRGIGKRCCLKVHGENGSWVKIGPRRRYCPWVKMSAWMRLRKGWAHGKDIPQGEDWVEGKMGLEK